MRFLRRGRCTRPRRESRRSGRLARAANPKECAAPVVAFGAPHLFTAGRSCALCWQGLWRLLRFECCSWASSSAGRAPRSQRGGRGFESHLVHQSLRAPSSTVNCSTRAGWRCSPITRAPTSAVSSLVTRLAGLSQGRSRITERSPVTGFSQTSPTFMGLRSGAPFGSGCDIRAQVSHRGRLVGNPYLIALRQSCPSLARKNVNVLDDKERQIFGDLSARTILQLIRTDLFAYDPHLEVWRWRDGPN